MAQEATRPGGKRKPGRKATVPLSAVKWPKERCAPSLCEARINVNEFPKA